MTKTFYSRLIFVSIAMVIAVASIAGYKNDWIYVLSVTALPWSVPISIISGLIVHAGDAGTYPFLMFLASLLNSILIIFYTFGHTRRPKVPPSIYEKI